MGEALESLQLEKVATGLTQPTDVVALPDGTLVITEQLGDVAVILPSGTPSDVANHINVVPIQGEQGLLGVAADVDFQADRSLYFYASAGAKVENKNQVLRALFDVNNKLGALTPVIEGLYGPGNHDGGGLVIFDHQLFVSVGDSGANSTPPINRLGTCLNTPNGKILRVNLNGSIPPDNPLADADSVTGCAALTQPFAPFAPDKRIYAWGLRNPFRFSIDPSTGLLWIGDVGEQAKEEIDIGGKGSDFGWPFYEGTVHYTQAQQSFQPTGACEGISPSRPCTPPLYEYIHELGRSAVIGGPVLDLCHWPVAWRSRYLFGDNGSGEVWTLDMTADRKGVVAGSLKPFAQLTNGGPASFRVGPDGSLYMVDLRAGEVSRVRPKVTVAESCVDHSAGGAAGSDAGGRGPGGGGGGAGGNGAEAGETHGGGDPGVPGPTGGALSSGGDSEEDLGEGGRAAIAPSRTQGSSGCGCRIAAVPTVPTAAALAALALTFLHRMRRVVRIRRRQGSADERSA